MTPSPRKRTSSPKRPTTARSGSKKRASASRRDTATPRGKTPSQRSSRGRGRGGAQRRRPPTMDRPHARKKDDVIPELAPDTIRIIPLGGVEEVGRNMTLVEFNDDIIVVDCGFMFQEENTPGVDYILPNTQYLEDRKEKVRGLVLTHGHLDHIGAIPYVIDRIGNPPVYSHHFTSVMVKKRQVEFPHLPPIDLRDVAPGEKVKIGALEVEFFTVTHTIPDSVGVIIRTPFGSVVFTGDIKLDHTDGSVHKHEIENFSVFRDEKVLCLLMDSTNTGRPGWSIPEHRVFDTFEEIIANAKHRMIIGTFASQVDRVIKIIEIAEKHGKKVVFEGRSMKNNLEIAIELGLLKTKKGTIITSEQMSDYPESKIIILATGAQGDAYAALMRMANKMHRFVTLNERDMVVLSSSVIPGNERAVQSLKDKIARQGPQIVTYETSDVHASGHGNAEEAKWIHQQVRPKFFIPQHGYHYMLRAHGNLMQEACGLSPADIVIPDNGTIVEIRNEGEELVRLEEKAPMTTRIVEGLHVRDIQEAVIKDRQALSQDGIFVIVATVNVRTGKLRKSPDIISRGFIYLRESQELLGQTRLLIKKTVEESMRNGRRTDIETTKNDLTDTVSRFLMQKTHKDPIVISVIVGV